MTLGLVTIVGLGEVGSATPLSLWSVFWHLGSQWQAVCCIRGRAVWSWWGEYFAGVLACCRGAFRGTEEPAFASSRFFLLRPTVKLPNEVGFAFVSKCLQSGSSTPRKSFCMAWIPAPSCQIKNCMGWQSVWL